MRHDALLFLTGVLGLGASACSASSPAAAAVADAAAPGPGPTADAGVPTTCAASTSQRPDGGTCVLEVEGTVADLAGNPLPGLVMTFCGPPQCYGTKADDAGAYAIPVGDFVLTGDYAMHADGRPDHAVDYLRQSAGESAILSVNMRVPALPPSTVSLPADGAPASSITVGDVTLQVAAGNTFTLDIADYTLGDAGRLLRVAPVPLSSAPVYATANNVDAIYALAPSGAKPSAKLGVSVRNTAGIPASAAVDVFVLSDDYFSTPPTVGTLVLAAAAHVSADGANIQTDPGEGISEITWLAVRRK
jgi:hypothetical protein